MIVVDDGAAAQAALRAGLRLALSLQAPVLLFHPLPPWEPWCVAGEVLPSALAQARAHERQCRARGEALLAAARAAALAAGLVPRVELGEGPSADAAVLAAAVHHGCALVVAGAQAGGRLARWLRGEGGDDLAHRLPVPLLLCGARAG